MPYANKGGPMVMMMYTVTVTENLPESADAYDVNCPTYEDALSYAFATVAIKKQTVTCFYGSTWHETEKGARIDCECTTGPYLYRMQIIIKEKAV